MIKDKYVKMKITLRNINHFLQYYKDIKLKDIINVKPEELQKNSNVKLNVECNICGIHRIIKYQAYQKNINSCEEYPIYTCDKCSHIKIKSFNRKKWGVDYFSQTKEYGEKFKSTMLERWGVEWSLQSEELREKMKRTNLEKFGVENPFMDNKMIKEKFKEKWGVDHPSKVEEIKEKIKKTNLDKFGFEWSLSSPEIRTRIKQTINNLYGANSAMQSDLIRDNKISNDRYYIKYIGSNISLFRCDNNLDHQFNMSSSEYHNRKRSNISLCTICNPIGDSSSLKEKELGDFISSVYSGSIIRSYRDGLEIDIYLPELKIGFEFNGLYWHSEEQKGRTYHLDKKNYFCERGIKIINIWEDDWSYKREIVQSQIINWLGLSSIKIGARNCEVKIIKSSADFLEENHIQGSDKSSIKIGLFYKNELVSIMTFDKFEGRKKLPDYEWNLSRFCNKKGMNIQGGASKLLSFFIKNWKTLRIISYADNDWSDGNLYSQLGFKLVSISNPDYKYIEKGRRLHKSNFKKSLLKTELTESSHTAKMGILRIWDCGKMKFEKLI
jgi:hypothetical protein